MRILSAYIKAFMISLACMVICISIYSFSCARDLNTKENRDKIIDILNGITIMDGELKLPDARTPEGARKIIDTCVALAFINSHDNQKLKDFNEPLDKMGVPIFLIPAGLVEGTLCKYFGYSMDGGYNNSEDYIADAYADKQVGSSGYFAINSGADGAEPPDIKIDNISLLNDGSLLAAGKFFGLGDDPGTSFKAIFKESNCGGNEHWVPVEISIPGDKETNNSTSSTAKPEAEELAPGYNECNNRAQSTPDYRDCANQAYNYWDKILNENYKKARAVCDNARVPKECHASLLKAERAWIVYKEEMANVIVDSFDGGTLGPLSADEFAAAETKRQAKMLDKLIINSGGE